MISISTYRIVNGELQVADDELYHYGVLGMKWGVRRAQYKKGQNNRLERKAYSLDAKAAGLTKRAERQHAKNDLERANNAALKSAKYAKRSAKLSKKALRSSSDLERAVLEKRAMRKAYKSAKFKRKADRLSKQVGYGFKAMRLSIKADKVLAKAAKARMKLASNKAYIERMKSKVRSIPQQEIDSGYSFVTALFDNG